MNKNDKKTNMIKQTNKRLNKLTNEKKSQNENKKSANEKINDPFFLLSIFFV